VRVLIVGSGAREDALSWRIAASPSCTAVFAAPGNAGTAARGENWPIAATAGKALARQCHDRAVDLVVLGPETAIAAGVGDRLREAGIAVFGPNRSAGRLESSKVFAKRFMERHGVPTARATVVHSLSHARKALEDWEGGVVVKADGLAAGKGVVVAKNADAARDVLAGWYGSGAIPGGGGDVLLEKLLTGREVSVFALCDGRAIVPFAAACDYKRAGDNDTGPNTGGMGAYSPPARFPTDLMDRVRSEILAPVFRGLQTDGDEYVGVLYCGLMWTGDGPRVIEFNARFGDPETQVLMPRIHGDFARLLNSVACGAIDPAATTMSSQHCAGIVLASPDYPRSNAPLEGLMADVALDNGGHAFWGGSTVLDGKVKTPGGRVLTVTALGDDLAAARAAAYANVKTLAARLGKPALTYRTDIAAL
jgi:phosphoribosylamine--glycine ligase